MRDFDEQNITAAVLASFSKTENPRLREIMTGIVKHLHDLTREVGLTTAEWNDAIAFLTRTGQMCTERRQEFILLSDTLGLSMLVDAINHHMPAGTTQTTVLGPFYIQAAPEALNGSDISAGFEGVPLYVEGTVTDGKGRPIANAIVDTWHADAEGFYDVQHDDPTNLAMRARLRTSSSGRFSFWSIMPRYYPIPDDGPVGAMLKATGRHPFRPAHVHFMIAAPGFETLVTHVFEEGDRYLDSDAVFGVKNSLVREFAHQKPGPAPERRTMATQWRLLSYDFGLKRLQSITSAEIPDA